MISGGSNAVLTFGAIGEQQRLQYVHHLRDVAHVEFVRLAIEDVESETGGDGAPHRALLPKFSVALLVFCGNVVPNSPLVEDQSNLLAVFIAVKYRSLMNNGLFDLGVRS